MIVPNPHCVPARNGRNEDTFSRTTAMTYFKRISAVVCIATIFHVLSVFSCLAAASKVPLPAPIVSRMNKKLSCSMLSKIIFSKSRQAPVNDQVVWIPSRGCPKTKAPVVHCVSKSGFSGPLRSTSTRWTPSLCAKEKVLSYNVKLGGSKSSTLVRIMFPKRTKSSTRMETLTPRRTFGSLRLPVAAIVPVRSTSDRRENVIAVAFNKLRRVAGWKDSFRSRLFADVQKVDGITYLVVFRFSEKFLEEV